MEELGGERLAWEPGEHAHGEEGSRQRPDDVDPQVKVDVHDDGALGIPHMRPDDPEAEDGRGWRLVNQVAQRWGFTREPGDSCCWAEIASPAT